MRLINAGTRQRPLVFGTRVEPGARGRLRRTLERLDPAPSDAANAQRDVVALQPKVGRVEIGAEELRSSRATAPQRTQCRVPQQRRHIRDVERQLQLDFGRDGVHREACLARA